MDRSQFRSVFDAYLDRIEALPEPYRSRLHELARETHERNERIQQAKADALASLDDWRLNMKYAVFAREAAARESASQNDED